MQGAWVPPSDQARDLKIPRGTKHLAQKVGAGNEQTLRQFRIGWPCMVPLFDTASSKSSYMRLV